MLPAVFSDVQNFKTRLPENSQRQDLACPTPV